MERKLEMSGLDSCPEKSQHSTLGVVLSTAEQGDGHVAYSWTRRRGYYIQINMKAEFMASRPRWQVSWISTGAVPVGEQSSAGNTRELRWIFFENAANTGTWSPRKTSPFLWALLGRWTWGVPFLHGSEALGSLKWLCPCQQHTYTQDFTHSGPPPLPTVTT